MLRFAFIRMLQEHRARALAVFITLLAAAFQAPLALAQKRAIRFERIGTEAGLVQGSVYAMAVDQQGFLWVGTADGLCRFDGYRMTSFRRTPGQPGTLADNRIQVLRVDREGTLWAGTQQGLHRFDRRSERFQVFTTAADRPDSLSYPWVSALLEDCRGDFWVGTSCGGLNLMDRASGSFRQFRAGGTSGGLCSDLVTCLAEDRLGRVWVGTQGGGLSCIQDGRVVDATTAVAWPGKAAGLDFVQTLCPGPDGNLWIGTRDNGLFCLDPETMAWRQYRHDPAVRDSLAADTVYALHFLQDGSLLVGTSAGLNWLEPGTDRFIHYRHDAPDPFSLSNDVVHSLCAASPDLLWVGTQFGLNKMLRSRLAFGHLKRDPLDQGTLSGNTIGAVLEDSRGTLWVGTDSRGLNRFDPGSSDFIHYRHDAADAHSLSDDAVFALAEDRGGNLWIGTAAGADRFDRATGRFTRLRHDPADRAGIGPGAVSSILQTADGSLWLGTFEHGLNRRDPVTGKFRHYRPDRTDCHSLNHVFVIALLEDSQGSLWVGSYIGGLDRYDPLIDGFHHHMHQPGEPGSLGHNAVLALHEDRQGNLWVGTLRGLDCMGPERESFTHFDESTGLPNETIYGILEDEQGFLWLSSNRGLIRFDPQSGEARAFHAGDGVQADEFNSNAYGKGAGGRLYFGGVNGLNAFFGDEVISPAPSGRLVFTGLFLDNRPATIGADALLPVAIGSLAGLSLTHDQDFISLEFAALGIGDPQRLTYQYHLEGFQKNWISTGPQARSAPFTNLDPGRYRLHVRALDPGGSTIAGPVTLPIRVRPPWWWTLGAKLVYLLLCLALIVGAFAGYRGRLRRQSQRIIQEAMARQQSQKLQALGRLAGGIAHDFNKFLASICGFNSLALKEAKAGSDLHAHLREVEKASLSAADLVDQILVFSRKGRVGFKSLDLKAVVGDALRLAEVAIPPGIRLRKDLADVGFVAGNPTQVKQIVLNLVDNAVLSFMADSGEILVRLTREDVPRRTKASPEVVLTVSDTGSGIPGDALPNIFEPFFTTRIGGRGAGLGLSVVYGITKAMKGDISVRSTPGQGTAFELRFPAAAGASPRTATEPARLHRGSGQHILWVDDDPQITRFGEKCLQQLGYRATCTTDAQWAWHHFLAAPEALDMVIIDYRMPGKRGDALGALFRRIRPDLPLILCSGQAEIQTVRDRAEGIFCDFLAKPFTTEGLATVVHHNLSASAQPLLAMGAK